ncbi:heparin lyase I family protein [Pseudomonas sp. NPDC090202]|uniref:heparin lyase I family protein n=1 Tax=unclassified Pseudomonas TaxID=196821 RepID=UPI003802B651
MTPINSLIRTPLVDVSHTPFTPPETQTGQRTPTGNGNTAVSFAAGPQNSQINFGGQNNLQQPPQNAQNLSANGNQSDPLTQLMGLIQEILQRLQAMIQGGSGGSSEPAGGGGSGVDGNGGGGKTGGAVNYAEGPQGTPQTGKTDGGSPASGNFSEHSLGNQLSVQKAPEDRIGMVNDPERGNVIGVDFKKGHYTEHSTSPRAEIKDGTQLQEGQPYSFKFGMKRESNNDGTFFQVLDHNNAKPSPRAWLATKDGQYQLHLKTSDDSNAPSKVINIGKPGDAAKDVGKWADFQIDFKRGIGNGEITVSKNGQALFSEKGISTMFDTHSSDSYAKFGQYRNEGDHKPATSLFSGFSVAKG